MSDPEAASLGFWFSENRRIAKKEREDAYAAAHAAMTQAIARLPSSTSEDTAVAQAQTADSRSPLLSNNMTSHAWCTATQKIVEGLKQENPMNIKLLTEVLVNTARYINHEQDKKANPHIENDPTILADYEATCKKVDGVYGRFSALSTALRGLPMAVLVGGLIGAVTLAIVFPPALIPVFCIAPFVVLAGTFASMIPGFKSETIRDSWKGLGTDLDKTTNSFRR